MPPRVRFFTGPTGQRIAYAIDGSGPPLVLPAWWVSHVERDWAEERFRSFFEPLAKHHTVIRYDRPGVGLSVRERSDFTQEGEVALLESLIDHLGFEHVSLLGFSCGGPPAVTYAHRHPKRVDRLVLVDSFVEGSALAPENFRRALVDLVRASWGLGSQTISDLFVPDLEKVETRRLSKNQREWATPDLAAKLVELTFQLNCREAARELTLPALVIHRRKDRTVRVEEGRALAALLQSADFLLLDGNAHVPWQGDAQPIVAAVLDFLGAPPANKRPVEMLGAADCLWHREGDLWRVAFEGKSVHLPHRKGLEDIALLLAHPMREIPAAELASGHGGEAETSTALGSDNVLDKRARSDFANRARAIEEELADSEEHQNLGRMEALRDEREVLLSELSAATGLRGRARRLGDPAERARKAVSARIRDSIKRLTAVHPELAAHLEKSVTTGRTCAYRPAPARNWRF